MKQANRFFLSSNWAKLLEDAGISAQAVLKYARLPADLFSGEEISLSVPQYFSLWDGIEQALGDDSVLSVLENMRVEHFDPPIFASLCSENLIRAAHRLKQYKPLIGPLSLDIKESEEGLRIRVEHINSVLPLPSSLSLLEVGFFTQLARLATGKSINPTSITLPQNPVGNRDCMAFFGTVPEQGDVVEVCFSWEDAKQTFVTANNTMWMFFEGELNRRLQDLDGSANTSDRVRAALRELLPAGHASIDDVADRLAMSKRTLQRKLTQSELTFQSILQEVRADLADYYLTTSALSLGEISFLLGFQEVNSFTRAFTTWNGVSPGLYRANLPKQ